MQLDDPDSKVYRHLRELKESFGPNCNRRDRAVVLIGACILKGFNTKHLIIKGTRVAGLSKNHVVGILDEQTGAVAGLHLWRCDSEGKYHLLDPV